MQQLFLGKVGIVAQGVVRFLACAGLLAAGLLMGGGIASADSVLGGLGIGHEKDNDNQPHNDADQRPDGPPLSESVPATIAEVSRSDRAEFGSAVNRDSAVASISVPTVPDSRSMSAESAERSTSGQVVPV